MAGQEGLGFGRELWAGGISMEVVLRTVGPRGAQQGSQCRERGYDGPSPEAPNTRRSGRRAEGSWKRRVRRKQLCDRVLSGNPGKGPMKEGGGITWPSS